MRQFQRVHETERTSSRICRRLRLLAVMGILRRYVSAIRWAFDSPSHRERERERDWFCVLVLQNTERSIYFWLFDRKVIVRSIRGNIPTLHTHTHIYIYIYIYRREFESSRYYFGEVSHVSWSWRLDLW